MALPVFRDIKTGLSPKAKTIQQQTSTRKTDHPDDKPT
jgi:hypothetical protein